MSDRRTWWMALGSLLTFGWLRRRRTRRGDTEAVSQRSLREGHQPQDDLSVGVVVLAVVVVLGLVGGALVAMAGLFGVLAGTDEGAPYEAPASAVQRVPPPPRLQEDPAIDLAELHRRENEMLHTYGWADRSAGRVRIPIDRAIALTAERGLPVADTTADSLRRVMTESGFVIERRGPPRPTSPAYLGSSPEPFVPAPGVLRELERPGSQLQDGPARVGGQ